MGAGQNNALSSGLKRIMLVIFYWGRIAATWAGVLVVAWIYATSTLWRPLGRWFIQLSQLLDDTHFVDDELIDSQSAPGTARGPDGRANVG